MSLFHPDSLGWPQDRRTREFKAGYYLGPPDADQPWWVCLDDKWLTIGSCQILGDGTARIDAEYVIYDGRNLSERAVWEMLVANGCPMESPT